MGFEVPVPVYVLNFDDRTRWSGLIVKMESAPIGVIFDIVRMSEDIKDMDGLAQIKKVQELLAAISDCLVSWNIERKGQSVPATLEGLHAQPLDLVLEIIQAWAKAVTEVPTPLVKRSTNGSTLEALPIETLSPDPVNL